MATVVAVFDNYSEAEQARTDLVESGVPERDVNITANEATGAQLSHLDTGDDSHLSFGERIAHFFRSLFGSDDDEDHTAHYAEAVRRGSCVLTDLSTYGTWVRFHGNDGPSNEIALRRGECVLHGSGEIGLGAPLSDITAPTIAFNTAGAQVQLSRREVAR